MAEKDKLVAIISPWEKLPALAKKGFRIESLPAEKKVIVWRDDLQTEQGLSEELKQVGITSHELKKRRTVNWREVD